MVNMDIVLSQLVIQLLISNSFTIQTGISYNLRGSEREIYTIDFLTSFLTIIHGHKILIGNLPIAVLGIELADYFEDLFFQYTNEKHR